MNKSIIILDKVFAALFAALGLTAAYGVIVKCAWWHIVTVGICAAIALASYKSIEKDEE